MGFCGPIEHFFLNISKSLISDLDSSLLDLIAYSFCLDFWEHLLWCHYQPKGLKNCLPCSCNTKQCQKSCLKGNHQ